MSLLFFISNFIVFLYSSTGSRSRSNDHPHMLSFVVGGLNVEGEADSWDFGVGMSLEVIKLDQLDVTLRI